MRIAVVTPRFGATIGGGAETLGREYALRLAGRGHDVTVLTTRAQDYHTWENVLPSGTSQDSGVTVRRFDVPTPRDPAAFDALSPRVLAEGGTELEERWMAMQGPTAPGLISHLETDGRDYDAILFIPYLYATTVFGLPHVARRAVLVPCFHDEPWLALGIFDPVVASAAAVLFNTPEERELAERRFTLPDLTDIGGAGIDPPAPTDGAAILRRLGIIRDYVVAVGRIDASKGTHDLVGDHAAYRNANPAAPDLVLVGRGDLPGRRPPWLHVTGFVPEPDKHALIRNAVALVSPSPFESLSIVLLEAWANGVPAIVTTRSAVLVGQTRRAGAGIWYEDGVEYAFAVDTLHRTPALARALGRAGQAFARHQSWDGVLDRMESVLGRVASGD